MEANDLIAVTRSRAHRCANGRVETRAITAAGE